MHVYEFYNKPTELDHWHKDEPDNIGFVEYRNEDGKLHREDGPAVILSDGTKEWYLNDKLHCEDGPAEIHPDGTEYWYLNGKRIK